jgi:hypothetical protein
MAFLTSPTFNPPQLPIQLGANGSVLTMVGGKPQFSPASGGAAINFNPTTQTITLGTANTVPGSIVAPAATGTHAGLDLTIAAGAGSGVAQNGGALNFFSGRGTGIASATDGNIFFSPGNRGLANQFTIQNNFDAIYQTNNPNPGNFSEFGCVNAAATDGAGAAFSVQNDLSGGLFLVTFSSVTTGAQAAGGPTGPISFITDSGGNPIVIGLGNVSQVFFDGNNNTVVTPPSQSTTKTQGFFYIPKVSGTPTGVPGALTGAYGNSIALQYDVSANKLWAYNGAWKQSAAFT